MLAAVALFVALALVGCQHTVTSDAQKPSSSWRVLERVGDVRMLTEEEAVGVPLLPGNEVAADRRVTAGTGALLILAQDGIQLTAGENTSLRLSDPTARAGLFLDRGWLRVRLAAAANRSARIKTPHFDISASSGTFTLRTMADETSLSVETGSAVLATSDGRHRATLVAGATARIDQASGSDLFVQQASGQAFTEVSPLPAAPEDGVGDNISSERIEKEEPRSDFPSGKASAVVRDRDIAIRPASRKKVERHALPTVPQPAEPADAPPSPPFSAPMSVTPSTDHGRSPRPDVVRSSMTSDRVDGRQGDPAVHRSVPFDPVQLNFDRLTDGLLSGL